MMLLTAVQQVIAVIPVLLLVLFGLWLLDDRDESRAGRRLLYLLAGVLLLPLPLFWPISFLLATLILAVLALMWLNLDHVETLSRLGQTGALLLGLVLAALLSLFWRVPPGVAFLILPGVGVLVLVAVWSLGRRYPQVAVGLTWVTLFSLFLLLFIGGTWSATTLPSWWARPSMLVHYLLPAFTVTLTAALISNALQPVGGAAEASGYWSLPEPRRKLLLLALGTLGCLAFVIFRGSVWDQSRDGLFGLLFLLPAGAAAVAVGMVMMVALTGKARLAGFLFLLFVPVLLSQALMLGWYF